MKSGGYCHRENRIEGQMQRDINLVCNFAEALS